MKVSDVKLLKDRGYELVAGQEHRIGEGAYSKVQLYYSLNLNKRVAIKIVNKTQAPRDFVQHFLPRELEVLQRVRHQNVVQIYEILATNDGRVFIAMEYADHGDVLKFIQMHGALDEDRGRHLFSQLTLAVAYLHEKGIVHRDLKCENLLLTRTVHKQQGMNERVHGEEPLLKNYDMDAVKLIVTDFGFSKRYERDGEKSRTFCGSAAYAAPEIIKGEAYQLRNHDMWSLGVILFIMACGTMPYDDSNIRKMLKDQLHKRLRYPPQAAYKLSSSCKDLIQKLIEPDPDSRYNIHQVIAHPWVHRTVQDLVSRMCMKKQNDNDYGCEIAAIKGSDGSSNGVEGRRISVANEMNVDGGVRNSKNSDKQGQSSSTSPKFWW